MWNLGTSNSNTKPSKSNEMLLLFIRIIGCLDILLLSVHLAVCIYDQTGQEKTVNVVSPSLNLPQQNTMYENIEDNLFSASGRNQTFVVLQWSMKIAIFNQTFRIFDYIKMCCVEYSQ